MEIKVMSSLLEDVKLFCQVCTEFWSNSSDCTAKLGANTAEQPSEMELYTILTTLENFECRNQTHDHILQKF